MKRIESYLETWELPYAVAFYDGDTTEQIVLLYSTSLQPLFNFPVCQTLIPKCTDPTHIHKRLVRRLVMGRIHVAFIHDHQLAVLLHHHCVAVHGHTHITHLHPPTLTRHFHHPLLLRVFLLHLMTHHPPLSPANLPNLRIADRCSSHLHSIPTRLALSDCCRSLAHILHKTRILILLLPITPNSVNHGIDRFLLQSGFLDVRLLLLVRKTLPNIGQFLADLPKSQTYPSTPPIFHASVLLAQTRHLLLVEERVRRASSFHSLRLRHGKHERLLDTTRHQKRVAPTSFSPFPLLV